MSKIIDVIQYTPNETNQAKVSMSEGANTLRFTVVIDLERKPGDSTEAGELLRRVLEATGIDHTATCYRSATLQLVKARAVQVPWLEKIIAATEKELGRELTDAELTMVKLVNSVKSKAS